MYKRQILEKIVKYICHISIVLSNIALCICCLLVFRGITSKQTQIVIFSLEMFVIFLFIIQLSNHFKNYFE